MPIATRIPTPLARRSSLLARSTLTPDVQTFCSLIDDVSGNTRALPFEQVQQRYRWVVVKDQNSIAVRIGDLHTPITLPAPKDAEELARGYSAMIVVDPHPDDFLGSHRRGLIGALSTPPPAATAALSKHRLEDRASQSCRAIPRGAVVGCE